MSTDNDVRCVNCVERCTSARQGRYWRVDRVPYWICHACTKRVMAGWIKRNLVWPAQSQTL